MSMNKTMVVARIVDRLIDEVDMTLKRENKALIISTMLYYGDGNSEVAISITCPKGRIAPNRVLLCAGSEKLLLKKSELSPSEYNAILIASGSAYTPEKNRNDIRKLIGEIMSKDKDIVDEKIIAILLHGEEAMA